MQAALDDGVLSENDRSRDIRAGPENNLPAGVSVRVEVRR